MERKFNYAMTNKYALKNEDLPASTDKQLRKKSPVQVNLTRKHIEEYHERKALDDELGW
ncbi:hypothetical protein [Candidatus Enterovibrio escicola]|uniref:hypothetical protein n=1 Tax=Candidatus Enterovibrio escicola TaxID=1927127 RepID=UPI001680097E|nr:hypothetical protein [Candidatus Enterovibrio escacola]